MAKPKANANVELLNNMFIYMFDYANTKPNKADNFGDMHRKPGVEYNNECFRLK